MELTLPKLVALALALLGLVLAWSMLPEHDAAVGVAVLVVVGIAFILFPDEIGGLTGYYARGRIVDAPTPGCMLVTIGWALLVIAIATAIAFLFFLVP